MIVQIVNISSPDVFNIYSRDYKISRDVYDSGLLGIEIRNVTKDIWDEVQKINANEKEIYSKSVNGELNLFIPGSLKKLKVFSGRLKLLVTKNLDFRISSVLDNYENYSLVKYRIGTKLFDFSKSYVMGILNITPDSFSDGGRFINRDVAVEYGLKMLAEGAHIIDVGGESTRPGSDSVSAEEEVDRVIPVIEGIHSSSPEAVISIDTNKSKVADEALLKGAVIVNDISGFSYDGEMIPVIKKHNASAIAMHIKGTPKNMQKNPEYVNIISEIYDSLLQQVQKASAAGIKQLFIDPGIGFGKTVEHNVEIINRIDDFKSMGYPITIGISRKSFLGKLLDLEVDKRDTATSIAEAVAITRGARIIRTHNVENGVQVSNLLNEMI